MDTNSDTEESMGSAAEPVVTAEQMREETETSILQNPSSGQYVEYDPNAIADAATNGQAVLFFHAAWCPTCISANADITSRASEIPAGLVIFKTDYDTFKDLKKKYGVTYQHTFVQVDADGNEIAKWNGGDLDEIMKNVK